MCLYILSEKVVPLLKVHSRNLKCGDSADEFNFIIIISSICSISIRVTITVVLLQWHYTFYKAFLLFGSKLCQTFGDSNNNLYEF